MGFNDVFPQPIKTWLRQEKIHPQQQKLWLLQTGTHFSKALKSETSKIWLPRHFTHLHPMWTYWPGLLVHRSQGVCSIQMIGRHVCRLEYNSALQEKRCAEKEHVFKQLQNKAEMLCEQNITLLKTVTEVHQSYTFQFRVCGNTCKNNFPSKLWEKKQAWSLEGLTWTIKSKWTLFKPPM